MKHFGHYSFARRTRRLHWNLCFKTEEVRFSFKKSIERGIDVGQASEIAINTAYGTRSKLVKAVQLVTRGRRKAAGWMWRLLGSHRQEPCNGRCHVGRQTAMHSHKIMGKQLAGLFSLSRNLTNRGLFMFKQLSSVTCSSNTCTWNLNAGTSLYKRTQHCIICKLNPRRK